MIFTIINIVKIAPKTLSFEKKVIQRSRFSPRYAPIAKKTLRAARCDHIQTFGTNDDITAAAIETRKNISLPFSR